MGSGPTSQPASKTIDLRREIRRCPDCAARFSRDAVFCPFDGARLETGAFDPLGDPLIGTVVDGRYEVLETLGEGGMGRVYRVRHASLGRDFALKALRADLAGDADLAARFVREAKAAASLRHPNVVQISDFGQLAHGAPYFVMELLSGHTLGEIIKAGGPVPAGRAVRIARQVAAGLGAAHAAGIVHRDMKPDNVFLVGASAVEPVEVGRSNAMLGEHVDVRIVDFGAAKVAGSGKVTRAGVVFGTPHYMSPEQASGGPLDHRADVYALGIIMYEMFTGRVPFEADTYMGVLTQHMFVQPIPPSQINAAARELGALEEVTLRCLEKKPEARYGSMEELSAAIDTAAVLRADGRVELAPRRRRSDTTTRPRGLAPMADELEPPTFEEKRAHDHRFDRDLARRAVAAGGAFIVATALVAAVVKWSRGGQGDPAGEKMTIGVSATPSAPAPAPAPAPPTATATATATAMTTPTPVPTPAATGVDARFGQVQGPGNVTHRAPVRRAPPAAPPAIDDVGDPFAPRAAGK